MTNIFLSMDYNTLYFMDSIETGGGIPVSANSKVSDLPNAPRYWANDATKWNLFTDSTMKQYQEFLSSRLKAKSKPAKRLKSKRGHAANSNTFQELSDEH